MPITVRNSALGTERRLLAGSLLEVLGPGGAIQDLIFDTASLPGGVTFFVAANDASQKSKERADWLCDGVQDQVEIQAAIFNLPSRGGTIGLSEGTFNVTQAGTSENPATPYCILVDESDGSIAIVGQPHATKIFLTSGQAPSVSALLIKGADGTTNRRTNSTHVYGIEFDGNQSGQSGFNDYGLVHTNYANNVKLENCYIHDAEHFGVHVLRDSQYFRVISCRFVNGPLQPVMRTESPYTIISGCYLEGDDANTVSVLAVVVNQDISVAAEGVILVNNIFVGGGLQATIGGARRCLIANNIFRDSLNASGWSLKIQGITDWDAEDVQASNNLFFNIRQGIQLAGNASWGVVRGRILDNQIIEGSGISLANGIVIDSAGSENCEIIGNRIHSASTAITDSGTGTIIRRNHGYTTENSGTGTINSGLTSTTITHGLSVTPTVDDITVTLAEDPTNTPGAIWVDTITATQFNVNCENDPGASNLDFGWRAVVL